MLNFELNIEVVIAIIVVFAFVWVRVDLFRNHKPGGWWKRHICSPCNYPGECFECNQGTCEGCPVLNHGD